MPPSTPPPLAVDAALVLRRFLLRAADALLPAAAGVWDRSMGVARTHLLDAMVELGVVDSLAAGPRGTSELSAELSLDADALHRLLRAAALEGLVRTDRRRRHRLTRLGRALRSEAPGSLGPWARYMALGSTRDAWAALPEAVRTGKPGFELAHGTSVWKWFADRPDEERLFADAMRHLTELDADAVAAASLWPETGTICDVAGGTGALLAAILAPRPKLAGVLVEAPGVLTEAAGHLRARGLGNRVALAEGDLLGAISANADVYVLKTVVHDWDDATSVRMLQTVRATMAPGARLVLIEQLQPRHRPRPFTTLVDLQMLTQCDGGRERSQEELRALLRAADLRPGRVERCGLHALVEGVAD